MRILRCQACRRPSALILFLGFYGLTPYLCNGQSTARPEPSDWFAGDAHVHRFIGCGRSDAKEMLTPQELYQGMMANNLAVISVLADMGNGEGKYQEQDLTLINGRDNSASTPDHLVHSDAEWHFDPEGVTFARKAIGGHLIVLGLDSGKAFFSQYTYPVFAWAKQHGAIVGFAHMQYLPYAFYPPPDGIPQSLDCCSPLEYPVETALGASSFLMEDVRGGDSAIQAYYRILNNGFRPGLAAGTDYPCNDLKPYGTLLTYVRIPDGRLTYRKWIEGIAQGRTVVSRNGHSEFLDLKVNGTASPGDEIRQAEKGSVEIRIEWRSLTKDLGRIELVHNGAVVASKTAWVAPDSPVVWETTLALGQSGWVAARRMGAWGNDGHLTHTGAVFVIVKGQPIRARAQDAEFFVKWIDNLLLMTSPGGAWSEYLTDDREAAQKRYREAREIFLERAVEAKE